jgi:hypothetical protein
MPLLSIVAGVAKSGHARLARKIPCPAHVRHEPCRNKSGREDRGQRRHAAACFRPGEGGSRSKCRCEREQYRQRQVLHVGTADDGVDGGTVEAFEREPLARSITGNLGGAHRFRDDVVDAKRARQRTLDQQRQPAIRPDPVRVLSEHRRTESARCHSERHGIELAGA